MTGPLFDRAQDRFHSIFKFIGCLRQNDDFHEAKRLSTRANTSS